MSAVPGKLMFSKINQFINDTLKPYFDYNVDFIKLHKFLRSASWHMPILLFSDENLNIINMICSIANFYGVGLEVVRTERQIEDTVCMRANAKKCDIYKSATPYIKYCQKRNVYFGPSHTS